MTEPDWNSSRPREYLGWLPDVCFIKQCEILQIHLNVHTINNSAERNVQLVQPLGCFLHGSQHRVKWQIGVETERDISDWSTSEWWCVGPGSGCSPCQLSVPLMSRSWGPRWLDLILDKAPIQPCPRHGLPLAQTTLPFSSPPSV